MKHDNQSYYEHSELDRSIFFFKCACGEMIDCRDDVEMSQHKDHKSHQDENCVLENDQVEATFLTFPTPISVTYEPQEDITVYELAQLLPVLLGHFPITEENLKALGSAARHLKRH